ncbi:hypothetical protein [Halorubrum lacusprofundi]|jgi:hypothetical protein|uniref:Uncharacterized protein n=1 Tax=Halorubrum lacusprofundi (strain ATCC 49239 / DSM 5036 / JCM 8891 / ACAM 34) TaxID=416348 RepID=B9LUJ2_HALLT|nr:hypothetical protein [Halorubrum lacusprofundi]ACM56349.1 hypothetical protein Hlac_0749 [Halorubrum lacusprofundi ATCC 49239]
MATCEECGDPVEAKNASGHFRDKCMDCIQDVADEVPSHRETCDDPDCLICSTP